ncbi:MAG: roadblock/LC7 domain-containing protein [Gammaproteobacteria bacterium]|nr:roadblock/LC7 domain-containing protein [Gammaproteobacteria bacterium]
MDSKDNGTEALNNVLLDLNASCDDILLSMITTSDGLTISSIGNTHEDKVSAMCSELLTVCSRSAKALKQGDVNEMLLRCSDTNMLLVPVGNLMVLALITKQEMNLGLLFIEAQRAKQAIIAYF